MNVIIHGATGAQGAPVLESVLAAGHDAAGLTRHTDGSNPNLIAADLDDRASLEAAYAKADGVFVHLPIPNDPEGPERWASSIIGALRSSPVRRVVVSTSGSSLVEAGDHPALQGMLHGNRAFHEALSATVDEVVALTPRLFLENLMLPFVVETIRAEGVLAYPLPPDRPVSWISHRDVAAAATRAFSADVAPGVYDIGHKAIGGDELAVRVGSGIGRDVRYEAMTPEAFIEQATPLFGHDTAAGIGELYRGYADDRSRAINDPATELGQPVSIDSWARTALA